MITRWMFVAVVASIPAAAAVVWACCPAPPSGRPVVNADQTVVIVWDAATKTQHFIRRAAFKAEADDFGFLIPTPSQPELNESGDGVFPVLAAVTAPKVKTMPRPRGGGGCGCSADAPMGATGALDVKVLEDKVVAGFHAVVLETRSSDDLVDWLGANGYAFSPEVRAWAKPYVEQGWKITALKVAKSKPGDPPATAPATTVEAGQNVATAALRMSFTTERPVFPYREPDPKSSARELGASSRLLRIYFIAEARYEGKMMGEPTENFTPPEQWTGRVAWAGKVSPAERTRALNLLKLSSEGPAEWWLTEFEDNWPYRAAPGDIYFARAVDQSAIERPPIVQYASGAPINLVESAPYILVVATVGLFPMFRRYIGRRVV